MMQTPLKLKARFLHKRVLDPATMKPMEYEITRIADGGVYYRPTGGGKSEYTPRELFFKVAP